MSPSVPLRGLSKEATDLLRSFGGEPTDLYRALANNDEALKGWIEMAWRLRTRARTPRALRELMILRSAQLQRAGWQWSDHFVMALAAGVSRERIEALESWEKSDLFDERARAALALTEGMLAGHVSEKVLADLEAEFDAEERVELILTAGFYCMVPRVLDALRLQPD